MRTRGTNPRRGKAWLAAAVALALAPGIGASPATAAEGGGANNVVQVRTTADDSWRTRARVQAVPFGGDSAQSTNLALAHGTDCTGCRTGAAALQAVFLTGSPSTAAPENAAVAVNTSCTDCTTFALAYQYVVSPNVPVSLGPQGRQALLDIQARANAAVARDAGVGQIRGDLDALFEEMKAVVDAELRVAGVQATTREVVHTDVAP